MNLGYIYVCHEVKNLKATMWNGEGGGKTARRYCFTIFDYEDPDVSGLEVFFAAQNATQYAGKYKVIYSKWQEELCPTTLTCHLQGWLATDTPVRWTALKALTNGEAGTWRSAHFEACRGSVLDNENYCSKVDSQCRGPWTFGDLEKVGQGARSDISALRAAVVSGAREHEIALSEEHFETYVKHSTGIRRVLELRDASTKRTWKTDFILYYGTPGSGKSVSAAADGEAYARGLEGNADKDRDELVFWWSPGNNADWWDGYLGQPVVIIDDAYSALRWQTLLRLGDSSPFQVQIKGGTKQFLARRIYFTSNSYFDSWYKFAENPNMDVGALDRRFVRIECFTGTHKNGDVERTVERGV